MHLKRPYPRCVFCGERATSREHVIPAWVSKRLGLGGELRAVEIAGFEGTHDTRQASVTNFRRRIFCKACNQHFKDLEDAVIPILEPMARGHSVTLGVDDQRLLALWGAKTGIAIVAPVPETGDLVPLDHRLTVRQKDTPHAQQWVGYSAWQGGVCAIIGDHTLTVPEDDHGFRAYQGVLTFGAVALKLFGLIQVPPGRVLDADWPSIKRVWPERGGELQWPPDAPPTTRRELAKFIHLVPTRPE